MRQIGVEIEEQIMGTRKNAKRLIYFIIFLFGIQGFGSDNDHPLLKNSNESVLSEIQEISSTAGKRDADLITKLIRSSEKLQSTMDLKIDFPLNKSVFPGEIIPPMILWHDSKENADTWFIDVSFKNNAHHIYVLVPGVHPPSGEKDPACEVDHIKYSPPAYQLNARSWTPSENIWSYIKKESLNGEANIRISGFDSSEPSILLSSNSVQIMTSPDPVDGCIFFRDVPLVPGMTKHGLIKPLAEGALPLITWRLRDICSLEAEHY